MHPNLLSRTLAASAAALLCHAATAAPAPQQLPFSFDAAPGHLPKNVVPIDYTVAIVPDASKRTLRGKESVKLLFREATANIEFNAIGMQFQQVRLDGKPVKSTVIDPKRQIVKVTLAKPAAAGEHTLTLDYTAQIDTGPRGLFAQPFKKPDGSQDLLLSTQFEAT
ncbi:MAG: hypothetical protein RLZZ237_737, partial [Pseudomonadota bacterium]